MKKIIIDTTISRVATITLLENGNQIEKITGGEPLPLIADLMTKHQLKIETTEFELVKEKGSYTGLKIGASLVNALGFIQGKDKLVFPEY